MSLLRRPRVLTCPKATRSTHFGEGVEVRRSPQAVACRKRCVREPRRPHRLRAGGKPDIRYTAIEARKGKPGHGVKPEPRWTEGTSEQAGGEVLSKGTPAGCRRGVLSGIVRGAWESHVHGEGPDGSTKPAKETHAGHVGLDQHEPTSLRGIANHATLVVWRGSEYNRGTRCGNTARRGLCGGRRVTGVPTAEESTGPAP
jgi:hypothetical protein